MGQKGKQDWQCITPECGRARYQGGEWCDACARRFGAGAQRTQKAPQTITATVYPTGETRRSDGQPQAEYTDGRQTWWANATEVAA